MKKNKCMAEGRKIQTIKFGEFKLIGLTVCMQLAGEGHQLMDSHSMTNIQRLQINGEGTIYVIFKGNPVKNKSAFPIGVAKVNIMPSGAVEITAHKELERQQQEFTKFKVLLEKLNYRRAIKTREAGETTRTNAVHRKLGLSRRIDPRRPK